MLRAELRKRPPSPAAPSPPVALGFAVWVCVCVRGGTPSSLGSFSPLNAHLGRLDPAVCPRGLLRRPAPLARSPPSRRGWNVLSSSRGRFLSAMLEADSCHRLRPAEERRGKGAGGHTARRPGCPGTLCGPFPGPPLPPALRAAAARLPSPSAPLRAAPGLCNPVAAARPRAGPWGEGRGRLGWGREAATRGAACTVAPRARRPRFPLPGAAGGAGGERALKGEGGPGGGGGGRGLSVPPACEGRGGFVLGRGGA